MTNLLGVYRQAGFSFWGCFAIGEIEKEIGEMVLRFCELVLQIGKITVLLAKSIAYSLKKQHLNTKDLP